MKTTIRKALVLFGLIGLVVLGLGDPARTFVARYNYLSSALTTNIVFKLYHSTSPGVPTTNWAVVATQTVTAISTNLYTTNYLSFQAGPGWNYVAMTASNEWGESVFSGVVGFNPASSPQLLDVTK